MSKWYESTLTDSSVVISSRVRLARNIKKYPFSIKLTDSQAEEAVTEIKEALLQNSDDFAKLSFVEVDKLNLNEKMSMMEKHIISPELVQKNQFCGVLLSDDYEASIMINEEDHIRIQTIFPGEDIEKAFEYADKIDNAIEENLEYAFDENYGYLTSCPTNVGTGMRASYMMHLPALERSGQLRNVIAAIIKFGITVRGIYGEGSEAMGSIYQVSNQITLGQSEKEILKNLINVSNQVIEQEVRMREKILNDMKNDFIDKVYRSYGILTNARKISSNEAMEYLSIMREGYLTEILDVPKPKCNIYSIMMNIQPGTIQSKMGNKIDTDENRDMLRAEYLRNQFITAM